MNGRSRWWRVLTAYTALLWAATLAAAALPAILPDTWAGTGYNIPPNIVLLNTLGTLGPALATAAFTMLAVTITLHRTQRTPPTPPVEAEDDWLDAT